MQYDQIQECVFRIHRYVIWQLMCEVSWEKKKYCGLHFSHDKDVFVALILTIWPEWEREQTSIQKRVATLSLNASIAMWLINYICNVTIGWFANSGRVSLHWCPIISPYDRWSLRWDITNIFQRWVHSAIPTKFRSVTCTCPDLNVQQRGMWRTYILLNS